MKNILAPSILSADFKILGEQLKLTEEAGAEYIHFDVMEECSFQAFPLECLFSHQSREQQHRHWMFISW